MSAKYRAALAVARVGVKEQQPVRPAVVEVLLEVLAEYEAATTWGTTCLNCSHLLDQLYALEAQREAVLAMGPLNWRDHAVNQLVYRESVRAALGVTDG